MAKLTYKDLEKPQNQKIFVDRIIKGGNFRLDKVNSDVYISTHYVNFTIHGKKEFFNKTKKLKEEHLRAFLSQRKPSEHLFVELLDQKNSKKKFKFIDLQKDNQFSFSGVQKKSTEMGAERQELGLINALLEAANKEAYIPGLGSSSPIVRAYKNKGLSKARQEPYIDIFIEDAKDAKLGISCKAEKSASLAGGGIIGLQLTVPDLLEKVYDRTTSYIQNDLGLKEDDIVPARFIPDIFLPIPSTYVKKIIEGNEFIGGPIDYMYIGKMDVSYRFNGRELKLNGKFYDIDSYIKTIGDFYFRIRKRNLDSSNTIRINYSKKDKSGYPILFQNPRNGKSNFRLVIDKTVSAKATLLKI